MSCWYKPRELSKRIAMFYTASLLAGAFGGLLAGGIIDALEGKANTRGWQWLFMIEGDYRPRSRVSACFGRVFLVFWSIFWIFFSGPPFFVLLVPSFSSSPLTVSL